MLHYQLNVLLNTLLTALYFQQGENQIIS